MAIVLLKVIEPKVEEIVDFWDSVKKLRETGVYNTGRELENLVKIISEKISFVRNYVWDNSFYTTRGGITYYLLKSIGDSTGRQIDIIGYPKQIDIEITGRVLIPSETGEIQQENYNFQNNKIETKVLLLDSENKPLESKSNPVTLIKEQGYLRERIYTFNNFDIKDSSGKREILL